jgi:protein-S-isoprenylcysteine O-methyltransferase Ste14
MMYQLEHALPATLLVFCLSSFAWSMRRFFVQPAGMTPGMRFTSALGFVSAAIHLATVLWPGTTTPERSVVAAALYVAALGLFWWAIAANRKAPLSAVFSPDLPQHLNDRGPYRFIRHPFYCSYLLTWIAGYVATFAWWLLPTVVAMLALYMRAARLEERKFSSSTLAKSYATYRERTGLFVPNPWKLLSARRIR